MEECVRCKEVDEDRRTLWMACFYEMDEMGIPFKHIFSGETSDVPRKFYTLRVCKDCRSDWMKMLTLWFVVPNSKPKSCGSGIFVREFGDNVEITEEEWNRRHPGIEPARYIGSEDE